MENRLKLHFDEKSVPAFSFGNVAQYVSRPPRPPRTTPRARRRRYRTFNG
jgi:hypothetical protein